MSLDMTRFWQTELNCCRVPKSHLLLTVRPKSNLCKTHKRASTRANTQHFQSPLPLQRRVQRRRVHVFVVCNSCSVCWSLRACATAKGDTGSPPVKETIIPHRAPDIWARGTRCCMESSHTLTHTHTSVHECERERDRHGYMKQSERGSWEKRFELP